MILDEYLKTYKEDLSEKRKYSLCIEIISKYRKVHKTIRDFKFPKLVSVERFVKKMDKILEKYIFVKYSQTNGVKFMYERLIINELIKLVSEQPNFTLSRDSKKIFKAKRVYPIQTIFKSLEYLNVFRFDPTKEALFDTSDILSQHSLKYFDFDNPVDNINDQYSAFKYPVIEPKISEEMLRIMKNNQKRSHDDLQDVGRRTRMRVNNDVAISSNSDNIPRITTTIQELSNSYRVDPSHENLTLLVDSIIDYNYAIDESNNGHLEITGMAMNSNGFIGLNQDGSIYEEHDSDENFQGYSPIEDEDEDEDENSEEDDENGQENDDSNVPTLDYDDSESEGEIIAENNTVHTETTSQPENSHQDDDADTITDEGYDSY